MNIEIRHVRDKEADRLLTLSTEYMESLYPAESNHLVDYGELFADNAIFMGAYLNGVAIGCVAVLFYQHDCDYGEIKRLFVLPDYRELKLGRRLMAAIEDAAIKAGKGRMRLETGIHQPASIHLYKSLGYIERGPYGDYQPDPLSVFMEKPLV